jgi:hypothetical protein
MPTRKFLFCQIRYVCLLATCFSINAVTVGAQQTSRSPVPQGGSTIAAESQNSAPVSLAGRWRGTWHSDSTGHKGPMQAHFRCAGTGRWEVVFRGRFCALIPFQYSAVLREQTSADGTVTLSGSRNLGPLLGTFQFRGTVSGGRLNARWWSKKESGSFVLMH